MRLCSGAKGSGMPLSPTAMLLKECLRTLLRQVGQRQQQPAMIASVVRLKRDDLPVTGDRFRDPPLLFQCQGEVVEGIHVGRAEAQGLPVVSLGLVDEPLLLEGVSQVVEGLGVIGLESKGLLKVHYRLIRL